MIGSKLTKKILKFMYGREEYDCFETTYRANTQRKLFKQLTNVGFKPDVFICNPDPSYWGFNRILFSIALFFEKLFPGRIAMHLVGRYQK
jgi:hypothetical protein